MASAEQVGVVVVTEAGIRKKKLRVTGGPRRMWGGGYLSGNRQDRQDAGRMGDYKLGMEHLPTRKRPERQEWRVKPAGWAGLARAVEARRWSGGGGISRKNVTVQSLVKIETAVQSPDGLERSHELA
jgi:hypothetical protein